MVFMNQNESSPIMRYCGNCGKGLIANKDLVRLGKGKIIWAERDYFKWTPYNYCVYITTPLDYSKAVLMLSFLGLLGVIFAVLLLRSDKKDKIGLELPNKTE